MIQGVRLWLCPGCQSGASKVKLLLQNIISAEIKREDRLNIVEEDITDVNKNFDECIGAIAAHMSSGAAEIDLDELKNDVATELIERQKELYVVVFCLPEQWQIHRGGGMPSNDKNSACEISDNIVNTKYSMQILSTTVCFT